MLLRFVARAVRILPSLPKLKAARLPPLPHPGVSGVGTGASWGHGLIVTVSDPGLSFWVTLIMWVPAVVGVHGR
ncbi:hypothetical protein ABIC28_001422 [Rhodococcus sp. PvR044]|nr:hypothetical protein [Rhodococcus sp. PvR099]